MDLVGHFRGQGLTWREKLQGQMFVGYRGHLNLLNVPIIKRLNFLLMRKSLRMCNTP